MRHPVVIEHFPLDFPAILKILLLINLFTYLLHAAQSLRS